MDESSDTNSDEFICFEENGVRLASIPLKDACKNSGYFEVCFLSNTLLIKIKGLFGSTWKETKSGERTFPFNAITENCSAADFTRFLHYLAGCRDECTRVDNPVSLLALIQVNSVLIVITWSFSSPIATCVPL